MTNKKSGGESDKEIWGMPTVSLAEILAENGLPADMTLEEFWDQCPWVDPMTSRCWTRRETR